MPIVPVEWKPTFVMLRIYCLGHLASYFHSGAEGSNEVFTPGSHFLSYSQRCGQHRHGGMGKQAIYSVRHRRDLSIIVVQGVARNPVGESSELGRQHHVSPNNGGLPGHAQIMHVPPYGIAGLTFTTCQHDA
jgi:hypothetical protein